MKIAAIEDLSSVNGEGQRLTLFLSGCIHKCKGCHNPIYQDYNFGVDWTNEELLVYIRERIHWIDGVTFSGGDPLYQLNNLRGLLEMLRDDPITKDLSIWLYTGSSFDEVPLPIKSLVDVILDNKYEQDKRPVKWRGSSNQNIYRKIQGHHFEKLTEKQVVEGVYRK